MCAGTRGIEDANTRRQGVTPCAGSFRSFICEMSQLKLLEDLKNALLCAGWPVDLHSQYFQGPMPCLFHDASSVFEQSLSGMAILTLPIHVRKGWYYTGFRIQQCSHMFTEMLMKRDWTALFIQMPAHVRVNFQRNGNVLFSKYSVLM